MNEPQKQITSPIKAIRAKCLDCCCDNANEVKQCELEKCPLWSFRFGKNPFNTRVLSPEAKEAAAKRMREMRRTKGGTSIGAEELP